ncbi:Glycine betaine/L-proline transport ATP-binding protein [Candidatus Phaeomarinobacter ectocarpi]|uniref:Glycine betaine/L-proline transport ATP-binding protein n=1 Tax=Candidatus Phaeomarinibacter ectocarpi TaxID=1458461 RepID=X5MB41_9HYPH|nr:ATP-binding cassette domain-containing protein [Candidatus Phaeomarinobacter ectocarpi]CDO61248.1 Glycine betaine/L-proline transport ATP-binding protein [Candidatus Phaeomarinobacter ectocarpi]
MISIDQASLLFGSNPGAVRQAVVAARQSAGRDRIRDQLGVTLALDDVSLDIKDGELFVVMGLSGSGKSTLVRLINGLLLPHAGSVTVDGVTVSALSKPDLIAFRRERIAMVFQSFALFPHRTVGENAAFGLTVAGMNKADREARASKWLERVGLGSHAGSYPHQLSGGMRQRVGLARALCVESPIMLLDEPFSALDPITRVDLQDLLLELQSELARTIVFVTHDFSEAARLADRMAVLENGRVAQIGTPAAIRSAPATSHVARFIEAATQTVPSSV